MTQTLYSEQQRSKQFAFLFWTVEILIVCLLKEAHGSYAGDTVELRESPEAMPTMPMQGTQVRASDAWQGKRQFNTF
jgi:hypothetical protein